MTQGFDRATRFAALGQGRFEREVDQGDYWGMVTPHGGYVMALMLSAMQQEVGDSARRPRTLTHHFLGKIAPGRIVVDVRLERQTRTLTAATARLLSGPGLAEIAGVASALFTIDRPGPQFLDEVAPEVEPPKEGEETPDSFVAPVHQGFRCCRRFGHDAAVVPVEDGGWILPRTRGPWDHRFALLLSDMWIPAIIRHPDRVAATPSLHQIVHFGPDVEGPGHEDFLVRHRLSQGAAGVTDEQIDLWAGDGRLLLQARQMRMAVPVGSIVPATADGASE